MQFVGANAQAQISGDAELPGKINYLTGNDPAQWRTGVAMFAKVRVGELYPGVNLVYYGNQQQLEYDFAIAPGANPDVIAIHFDGTDKISVNPQGELILALAGGEIRQPKPVIYQTDGGVRKEIAGGYRLVDAHTVAFAVGQYDRSQPLVIDPVWGFRPTSAARRATRPGRWPWTPTGNHLCHGGNVFPKLYKRVGTWAGFFHFWSLSNKLQRWQICR
jgi:hypothetical protein